MKKSVIIIGAGASGLFCAIEAAKRGRDVLVIEHANKVGKKILMSGGGRCNFTNYYVSPEQYESSNTHFCKSALSRYTPADFIALVESYGIAYHEKTLGQLFCDHKSKDIVDVLMSECEKYNVDVRINTSLNRYQQLPDGGFSLKTSAGDYLCESLVIATGGLSIPTLGASGFGYEVARHFGLNVLPTSAGLVPFCLSEADRAKYAVLSGISADARVWNERKSFRESILFTHRGLSGPAVLQISSYWQMGEMVFIDLLPDIDVKACLLDLKRVKPQQKLKTALEHRLSKRLLELFLDEPLLNKSFADLSHKDIDVVFERLCRWSVKPVSTEGYRTAEVTLGGVDPNELSSKTFEAKKVPGLYFVGEVIDVSGWLGGYNFQWAWASAFAAGEVV